MTEEIRYKVSDGYAKRPVVAKVLGYRTEKTVRVASISVFRYASRLTVEDWDKLPKTPDEARKAWIDEHRESLSRHKTHVEMAEDSLNHEINHVRSYEVMEVR